MPPFVKAKPLREPGKGEKNCPDCQHTGRVDGHMCTTCHGSGVVSDNESKETSPDSEAGGG